MKLKQLIASALLCSFLVASPVLALDPKVEDLLDQPATVAGKNTEEIGKIRDEIKKAVEEKLRQVIGSQAKRGWIGTIMEKDKTSLVIKDQKDQRREILLDEEVKIINTKRKVVEAEELVVGKKILAMGYLQSETILEARRIVLLNPESKRKLNAIMGVISDKSRERNLIAVTPLKNADQVIEISVNSNSKIISAEGKPSSYDDLEAGQRIIVVIAKNEETNVAKILKILPQNN